MPILVFALVVAAIAAVAFFALRGRDTEAVEGVTLTIESLQRNAHANDVAFDRFVQSMEEGGAVTFPARIAGCTFRNDDGTNRQRLIRDVKPFDMLELRREPDSPYDKFAVQIRTKDGKQLGYLEKRVAHETARKMDRGEVWIATVRSIGISEDGSHWGARIQLFGWEKGHVFS